MLGSRSFADMSPPPTTKHDVFLSFRGEDTRDNFISHLNAELGRKKIETFMDHRLARGEEISPALCKAIEESMSYVVILSENYASSTWCLDELTKILECRDRYGRDVIPIFYKVDPSDVRNQRQSYAEAFVKHQRRFKDDQVDAWKAALTQVAGLSGWDSQVTRPEHTLIEEIVKDVSRKLNLNHSFLNDYQGMIGIDKHIEQLQSLLHLESEDVRVVGIWGMGGIGKTTIARAIYHKLATKFSSRSIILNVRQEVERAGVHHMQSKYISELLGEDSTSSGLSRSYDRRLKWTKALLVLDDVSHSNQLKDLIGTCSNFGKGSRIIVTSRDMQVLKNAEASGVYEVKEMNFHDSLQLFSLNAFKQNYPIEPYVDLSKKVLNYAKGVPLALEVLGSLLYSRRTEEAWENLLKKLEKLPNDNIFKMLKLSYEGLDEEEKDIFLDIACFYRGKSENVVALTLYSCGFSAHIGLEALKDRCLISILDGIIVMHDLIQEMGHEIVRQQCIDDPGKRSRLWKHEEIYKVLRNNKGTDAIRCIFLDICKIEKVQLHAETFKKMDNLRMMLFYNPYGFSKESNVILPACLESLPDDLKFLRWDGFPQKSFPLDFSPKNLVKLDMPHSHLKQLWQGDKYLPNLKTLDLRGSQSLIQIPDLGQCPNIEEVILSHCTKLGKVYSSSFLRMLKCLWLNGCISLKSLQILSNILLTASGLIVAHGCCNLEMFSVGNVKIGVQLHSRSIRRRKGSQKEKRNAQSSSRYEKFSNSFDPLDCCLELDKEPKDNMQLLKLEVLREGSPSLFPSLNELCWLDLSYCDFLFSLPTEIFKLKFLKRLYLNNCLNLEKFGEIKGTIESLTVLVLDKTAIKELPPSLHHLVGLEELSLYGCRELKIIPSSIGSLGKLSMLDITCCKSLETFPSSIFKLKLTKLDLRGCSMLKTFPDILEPAETFVHINLSNTAIKELPSSLHHLVGLEELSLRGCRELEIIPSSIGSLGKLSKLNLTYCKSLETFPSSIFKLKLTKLDLEGCLTLKTFPDILEPVETFVHINLSNTAIKELPPSLHHLVGLEELSLRGCRELEIIPSSIGSLGKLSKLNLTYCESLETFPSSIFKLKLTKLNLQGCSMLKTFPDILEPAETFVHINLSYTAIKELPSSLHHLVGLEKLSLCDCRELEIIPSSIESLGKLSKLNLSYCESLETLPSSIFKLKLTKLALQGCSMLKTFPDILEPAETFVHINLSNTAIKELPPSLHHLVGLEELSLCVCRELEIIPSSIESLGKLSKLNLSYCESLETLPSSIFKLKLTKLALQGCSMLKTFPDILEPAETFVHINLSKTAIKELPSSVEYLVRLQTLCLNRCSNLVSLPNSIGNLNYLSELDCSGCCSIVKLPESIAHLSSLKSLDLSYCKSLACIPQLPPSLNQLFAYDCPSVGRIMPNSRLELPSDGRMMPNSRLELPSNSVGRMIPNSWMEPQSNFGKDTFRFHFTNNQELDETACSNIGAEAWLRITEDAYRSVFFCFPGSAVPGWFPYRCTGGHLVTMKRDSQDLPSNNRLVGFALSVVLGRVEMDNIPAPAPAPPHGIASFTYRLTYESDGCTHILPNNDKIKSSFYWRYGWRSVIEDHTFIWKYHLDFASIGNKLLDAHNFTFRFIKEEDEDQSSVIVKKCGVCPLYTKEKDDNRGNDNNGLSLATNKPMRKAPVDHRS